MQTALNNRLNEAQLQLIKSFKYLHNAKEINEIDSLINFYLERKLDEAIVKKEAQSEYNAAIYEAWLNNLGAK